MKTIKTGDERVAKIIAKKNLSSEAEYRLSLYTYLYSENDRYLIQHTMTREVTELTPREWSAVKLLSEMPRNLDFLQDNGLTELARKRYIVETDCDDVAKYQNMCFLLKTMAKKKNGLGSYTIFPTTGCNARCVYCYEEGYAVKNMTPEIADRLVDFICETRHDDTVTLRWFGGEPLAGVHIIRHICTALQERGVPYKSSMVTNASLMTKELAHETKELWHLKKVQVSLDGAREDYTPRKNYYNPEKHNYDVVMQAIHYLADEGIKVNLRVNFDWENLDRLSGFFRDIKAEFGDMEKITMYIAPLFQVQHTDSITDLYRKMFELEDEMKKLGLTQSTKDHESVRIRVNYCMADSMDSSIVITPDGVFYNCEHLPETQTWGNIFDGVTDQAKFDELKKPLNVDEKCAKCPFLPQCTPFYKNGCPGWFEKCYEYRCLAAEYALHNLLKGENTETEDDDETL